MAKKQNSINLDLVFSDYKKERGNVLAIVDANNVRAQKKAINSIFYRKTKFREAILKDSDAFYKASLFIFDLPPKMQYYALEKMLRLTLYSKYTWNKPCELFAGRHKNKKLQKLYNKIYDRILEIGDIGNGLGDYLLGTQGR